MHSFVAYIDESGDEGFVFKDWPDKASSQWFLLSACVIRASNILPAMRIIKTALAPIEKDRKTPAHFSSLPHDARVRLCHAIGKSPFRIIVIAVNKAALPRGHTLKGERRLYFYYTRYLIERISWIARDRHRTNDGDGTCKLVFSKAKNLSYEKMKSYLYKLKERDDVQIVWETINPDKIEVSQPHLSVGLRLADATASGVAQALELGRHGYCEDRYVRLMRDKIYRNGDNYLSYGMKIVPAIPTVEPERDNRYSWIGWFR